MEETKYLLKLNRLKTIFENNVKVKTSKDETSD